MNFNEYKAIEKSVSIKLNDEGKETLRFILKTYANFTLTDDELMMVALNDTGFQDDGDVHLELSSTETKSGQPHTYTLNFDEHFEVAVSE